MFSQHGVPVAEGAYEVLPERAIVILSLRAQAPRGVFVPLRNVERAKQAIPDAGDCGEVGVVVFFKITVVRVVHHRAVQPFR